MKALILNSGVGARMGEITRTQPKCMTLLDGCETIVGRQLRMLAEIGISEIIMTTGPFAETLEKHCSELNLPINIKFVNNSKYKETNYIYSMYCAREYLHDDFLLIHGDVVFDYGVLRELIECENSCMVISTTKQLPIKDFKAVLEQEKISKIGIEFFDNAVAAQPVYKLLRKDLEIWLSEICNFCENGQVKCYAENAFNEISDRCRIYALDIKDKLCLEIDTVLDLKNANEKIRNNTVYMCFSTDLIHSGHIALIKKASKLGRLIIGVLSDEVVASYKRFPLLPFAERKTMFENIVGVDMVVKQDTLSYKDNLMHLKPTYVVHGDDWKKGFQKPIREEVQEILSQYGGELVEFPYADDDKFQELEKRARKELSLPDIRRGRLKKILELKGIVSAIEAHSGITGLIAENSVFHKDGAVRQFDAMWVSSLCDSIAKGKPDIELVDMTSRFRTIDDIMEVTTKPIIFDGDTGGLIEHFTYTVRTLERIGVSMVIIEDKTGLKKNSLFGTEVVQNQDSIENFQAKIRAGKKAQKTNEFMICARIESLILEKGMEDALERAFAYCEAGADAIMIHSRKKAPDEIFEFVEKFRASNDSTPIIVVPTSFNTVTEEEFKKRGVNVVIYANQLTRVGFPAMQNAANLILEHQRAKECDDICMPVKEIIRLIPEE